MRNFAIRSLNANGIGPFTQLSIKFPQKVTKGKAEVHILTGENGTGKTTVLQMLANCVPTENGLILKKIRNSKKSNYTISFSDNSKVLYDESLINIEKNSILKAYRRGIGDFFPDHFPNQLEKWSYGDDTDSISTAFFAYSGYRKLGSSTIDAITELKSSPFENSLDFDKSTDPQIFINWLAITITKNAIAYTKKSNHDKERAFLYYKPIAELQKIISDITGWEIEFELQEDPLAVLVNVDEQPLFFEQLPDGLKSIISWLGDLIMRLDRINWNTSMPLNERNFILFLDEIDIHLHPSWQRQILPVVQRLFPNAQIFVSTHSPFVVGSIDGAWVYQFVRDNEYNSTPKEPILSEDSYSYEYILAEIFGISERFGIEVEKDLNEFKVFKNKIIRETNNYDYEEFKRLIIRLMNQSSEVQSIIGMELRQLSRLTNQTFF